jgi:O-antigen/teichoic acid export membrane protein
MADLVIEATGARTPLAPSLRSNFSWTLTGNVIYSGCQWGMISALAKFGSASAVGSFALGLAITAPVFMFTNLQLRAIQATDARSEFAFADYFTLRVLASVCGLFVICLIVAATRYDIETRAVILLVGVSKTIESFGDVIAGLLQKAERLDRVSISLMLRGGFSLPAFAATYWISHSLIAAVLAMIAVWLSVFLFYDLRQARILIRRRDRFFAYRRLQLKRLALVSAPLGIVMTLISLNVNIPRYILERFGGSEELGVFASLAYLIVAMNLVVSALSQSAITRLSLLFSEMRFKDFSRLVFRLSMFGVAMIAVGVPLSLLAGRAVLSILYRPEYGHHVVTLGILVAAAGLSSTSFFVNSGLNAARSFRAQIPIFGASTATTILAGLLLIPPWHMNGAALAMLLSAAVGLAGNLWVMRSILANGVV